MFTAVINLKDDAERMGRMHALLTRMDLPYTRIEGLRGEALPPEIRAQHAGVLSDPELGCMESHLAAWRAFLASDHEKCLVLEDDVHFAAGFRSFIDALDQQPQVETGVIKLETMLARVTLGRTAVFSHEGRGVYPLHSNHGGTAAYVMNRETAETLVRQRPNFIHAVDTEVFDLRRRQADDLDTFQVYPALCMQDFLLGARGVVQNKSNIGTLRAHVMKAQDDGAWMRIFRPLYTMFYSAGLAAWGRRRVDARFPAT